MFFKVEKFNYNKKISNNYLKLHTKKTKIQMQVTVIQTEKIVSHTLPRRTQKMCTEKKTKRTSKKKEKRKHKTQQEKTENTQNKPLFHPGKLIKYLMLFVDVCELNIV